MKYSEMSDAEIKVRSIGAYLNNSSPVGRNTALWMAGWNAVEAGLSLNWRMVAEMADYCDEPVTHPSAKP